MSSRNHSLEYEQDGQQQHHEHKVQEEDTEEDGEDHEPELKWTDAVEQTPTPLTLEVLVELDGSRYLSRGSSAFDFHLGLRRITIAMHEQAVTYFVRPDVTADSVFSLIEQVCV